MFYILYHSAQMTGRIHKLNAVSTKCKTLKGILALFDVTVGPLQQSVHRKGRPIQNNGKVPRLSLTLGPYNSMLSFPSHFFQLIMR